MASIEKQINARFQLKYDSFANWNAKNPELKSGEVAIAYLGDTVNKNETGHGNNHPVLFKVGPGNFNSLPWASALAADVHAWAKKTENEFKTWVKGLVDVTDIDAYSKGEVDGLLSANSQADQKYAKDYADGLAKNYDAAGAAAAVLGTNADNAGAATVHGALKAAAAAQADINAFFAGAEKGEAALDTLKEIQAFLDSDEGTVQSLLDDVAENKGAIEDIVDGTTKVAAATNADVAAKASGLNAAGEAAVKAVKVDNAGNADQLDGVAAANYLQKSDAPGYADILTKTNAATLYQPVGNYATAAQGALADTAVQPAALNDYYTKSQADAAFMDSTETGKAIDAKITALNLAATYEPIGAETRAKAYADGLAGNYATAAQGAKADSALQEITTTVGGGLKVTNKNQIDIDPDVVFVFCAGDASTLI